MYMQHSQQPPEQLSVPERYSGNAFRYPPIGSLQPTQLQKEQRTAPHVSSALPTETQRGRALPFLQEESVEQPTVDPQSDAVAEAIAEQQPSDVVPASVQGKTNGEATGLGSALSFLRGGAVSDELLLLGLFLILNRERAAGEGGSFDDHVLPLLLLLLFCG